MGYADLRRTRAAEAILRFILVGGDASADNPDSWDFTNSAFISVDLWVLK